MMGSELDSYMPVKYIYQCSGNGSNTSKNALGSCSGSVPLKETSEGSRIMDDTNAVLEDLNKFWNNILAKLPPR